MEINLWEIIKDTGPVLLKFWKSWLVLLMIFIIIFFIRLLSSEQKRIIDIILFKRGEKGQSDRDLLRWLRGMKPAEFEDYVAELFFRLGYSSKKVGGPNDGGIDVIIKKDGAKSYIQCKKFLTSQVPVGAVRDFYGALMGISPKSKGYFITTNIFTPAAKDFARGKQIELVDGYKLIRYIREARGEKRKIFGGKEPDNLVCPLCGGKLKERSGRFGVFYGCENYPKCKYTNNFKQ